MTDTSERRRQVTISPMKVDMCLYGDGRQVVEGRENALVSDVERSDNIEVVVSADGMSEPAKTRFREYVQRFADDLSRETMRLEEGDRAQDLNVREITTTMVVRANEVVRRPSKIPNLPSTSSGPVLALQTFSFTAALIAGVLGSYLHSALQWIFFLSTLVVAVAVQIVSAIILRRQK